MEPIESVLVRRHLVAGWTGLLVFLVLGLALETLHGFKMSWYLAADHEVRRFLWVLAHAHGALLAMLNIVYALSIRQPDCAAASGPVSSIGLLAAMVLMPVGFFTGGLVIYNGDPGPGILLALIGAVLLIGGISQFVWRLWRRAGR